MARACKKYLPARMDKRLTFQAVTRVADGQGGFTETWADAATVWGSLEPLKGYEKFQAMQTETPVTHRVQVRYNAAFTTAKRMTHGVRTFDVKEVINENEAGAFMRLTVVEKA